MELKYVFSSHKVIKSEKNLVFRSMSHNTEELFMIKARGGGMRHKLKEECIFNSFIGAFETKNVPEQQHYNKRY